MAVDDSSTKPLILTPAQRRERNREEVRQAILEAARAVIREDGVAALNFNEVARRVGMKTPSLYEYFPGKMAVYDALYLLGVRLYARQLEEALKPGDDVWAWIEFVITNFFNFAYRHPDLYHVVFERHVPEFVPSEESMAESRQNLGNLTGILQRFMANGQLQTNLPLETVRDILIVVLYGITSQHMSNQPHLPLGQGRFGSLVPTIIDILKAAWQPRG